MRLIGQGGWGPRNRSIVGVWAVIQAGTTGKLHSSYNVASYTDNGAGDHTLTFVVPFGGANEYACTFGTAATNRTVTYQDEATATAAGSLRIKTINSGNALTDIDPTTVLCVGRR